MPAPYHCLLQAGCPSCRPTNSIKALKAKAMKANVASDNKNHEYNDLPSKVAVFVVVRACNSTKHSRLCSLAPASNSLRSWRHLHIHRHLYVIIYLPSTGSRVVSVLDSGAEGPGFKSQSRRCRVSLRQTVHTHSPSSKIGSIPLKGCEGNCRPGGK